MKCKFCGKEVHTEKYLSVNEKDISCGECTSYCMKTCELGKSGKVQGWHFEPCLSCKNNPYNKYGKGDK
ncbi:MAG: hypothetical protein UIM25_07265 [Bacteroidales bacterium]|nr:hypothetical protein [Bacteroidales bacterium]